MSNTYFDRKLNTREDTRKKTLATMIVKFPPNLF